MGGPLVRRSEEQEVHTRLALTVDDVMRRVGAGCTYQISRAILRSDNPMERITAVKSALRTFRNVVRDNPTYGFKALENEHIAEFFVRDPNRVVSAFRDIARAARDDATSAFCALASPLIAEFFVRDPTRAVASFRDLARATGVGLGPVLGSLETPLIAEFFVRDPTRAVASFRDLVRATGDYCELAFGQLAHGRLAQLFVTHTNEFLQVARAAGTDVAKHALASLEDPRLYDLFMSYTRREIEFNPLMLNILSSDSVAIELGRALDDYHDSPAKRRQYMNGLSTLQVLGLLSSNPEYFYTSTNHMLFDRLRQDLGTRSVGDLFREYHVDQTMTRNFLFRSINYRRFYGTQNSVLTQQDLGTMLDALLQPIASDQFDSRYYFLLANSLQNISGIPALRDRLAASFESRLLELSRGPQTQPRIAMSSALRYLLFQLNPETTTIPANERTAILALQERAHYTPTDYRTSDGRLLVIQVFDKDDTESSHWRLSREWLRRYDRAPTVGRSGERIYETKTARVVLFMGETQQANRDFVSRQLQENPNLIVTFRGHSYSLQGSFPYDIFRNRSGHVLFIPGSCGSSGSTARYISANPNTDLRFFSNTSTGRGQVTNTILDELIRTPRPTEFREILRRVERDVSRYGGDTSTVMVWSSGEALLRYVYSGRNAPRSGTI